jgi:sterol-4alpha-carboxylate 3-dehydrogenase (decarboxylating)
VYEAQDLINVDERLPFPEKPIDAYNDTKVRCLPLCLPSVLIATLIST